jgi:hypothetical protein
MNDGASRTPKSVSWRTTALVASVWLFGCPLAGIVAAFLSGEFGSIGFVVMGLYVGVLGALIHAVLSRSAAFLGFTYPSQVLISSGAAALPLLLFSLATVGTGSIIGFVRVFGLPICVFATGAAWVGVEIVHRRSV